MSSTRINCPSCDSNLYSSYKGDHPAASASEKDWIEFLSERLDTHSDHRYRCELVAKAMPVYWDKNRARETGKVTVLVEFEMDGKWRTQREFRKFLNEYIADTRNGLPRGVYGARESFGITKGKLKSLKVNSCEPTKAEVPVLPEDYESGYWDWDDDNWDDF